MNKNNLVLKVAVGLITFGLVFTAIGALMGGKFTILKDEIGYRAYDKDNRLTDSSSLEEFEIISIDVDLDKIEIIRSVENKLELDYSERAGTIGYKVENNTLTVNQIKANTVGVDVNIGNLNKKNIDTLKIFVSNDTEINKILINQNYGNLIVNGLNFEVAEINSNYGNVNFNDLIAKEITITMEDGNITSSNLDVSDTFNLHNKYGNIDLDNSDFSNLVVYVEDGNLDISKVNAYYSEFKNKYGNTYAVDFTTNGLLVNAHDGDIELRGSFLGSSTVNNKYGNVNIISNDSEGSFDYSILNKYGTVDINNKIHDGSISKTNNANNNLSVTCEDGNVKITFNDN